MKLLRLTLYQPRNLHAKADYKIFKTETLSYLYSENNIHKSWPMDLNQLKTLYPIFFANLHQEQFLFKLEYLDDSSSNSLVGKGKLPYFVLITEGLFTWIFV